MSVINSAVIIIVVSNIIACSVKAKLVINIDGMETSNNIESWCSQRKFEEFFSEMDHLEAETKEFRSKLKEINDKITNTSAAFDTFMQDYKQQLGIIKTTPIIASCSETLLSDEGLQSAEYLLKIPNVNLPAFPVLCLRDTHQGAAWTVIQRRQDGSIDFYRNWDDYVHGFGNLRGEFWLGLEKIHALTTERKHELWIRFDDFEGLSYYAKYDEFRIGDRRSFYELEVLGKFHGTAGNALNTHKNEKFTTKDSDNDKQLNSNCAVTNHGAWWYRKCFSSNLNGRYKLEQDKVQGIEWYQFRADYSLKYVHMAIRPVQ